MTEESGSQWRKKLAEQAALPYTTNPHVDSVILGGSTARGYADRFSDIEIGVFWHQPLKDKEREEMANRTGGELLRLYPFNESEQVWSDDLMLGRSSTSDSKSGVLLEVVHYTNSFVERTLEAVLVAYDPDELKQNLIAGIMDGNPLKDSPALQRWRSRAADYPDGLALAVVRRHAQIDHFWRWRMWLMRGPNLLMLNKSFVQIEEKILHMLLGLNKVYYFGFKWLDFVIDRMTIMPSDFAPRFKEIHTLRPEEAVSRLTELVEEIYALVERHMPDLDMARLRSIFRYERPVWDSQPPVMDW